MNGKISDCDCGLFAGWINDGVEVFWVLGSEVKEIESTGGVLTVL